MSEQYSPTGFRVLPTVVKHLLIINVLMYLATITLPRFGIDLEELLALHFYKASGFRVYQLVTYMFMHGSFAHLFFNMFALWMFGNTIENIWGSKRFLFFYMVCGIGAGLCQELVQFIQLQFYDISEEAWGVIISQGGELLKAHQNWSDSTLGNVNLIVNTTTVGASGAIYGLLLAFGMMFPDSRIYLYFFIPIKAKWFVIGYAVIELIMGLQSINPTSADNVAHFAHLGGMLFGLLLILYWRKHPAGPNKDFKKLKDIFQSWKDRKKYTPYEEVKDVPRSDEEYNYKKAQKEREVDAILDKVAKNGYGSLTDEEKDFLFKNSK